MSRGRRLLRRDSQCSGAREYLFKGDNLLHFLKKIKAELDGT